jgi:microtubule-associated protein-like 6
MKVLELEAQVKESDKIVCVSNHIKAMDVSKDGKYLVIGTKGSEIIKYKLNEKFEVGEYTVINQSHCAYELWGLACNPNGEEYCTVGDDKTLRLWQWRSGKFSQSGLVKLGGISRAVAYAKSGKYILAGQGGRIGKGKEMGAGIINIVSVKPLEWLKTIETPGKQWITDIKFSPKGMYVAVASHSRVIYLYEWDEGVLDDKSKNGNPLILKTVFEGHNSFVTHIGKVKIL